MFCKRNIDQTNCNICAVPALTQHMQKVQCWTSEKLTPPSTYPNLFLFLTVNSIVLQQKKNCHQRHLIYRYLHKTTFSPPYPEHDNPPSILPDTFAQCDNDFRTAQRGRRDHPLKSAHVCPFINHPGEELASRSPCLFLAVQLPIWMADWRLRVDLVRSLSGPGQDNPGR